MADSSSLPVCSTTETLMTAAEGVSVNFGAADGGQAMTLTVNHFPLGQMDETGDGVGKVHDPSAVPVKQESGLI